MNDTPDRPRRPGQSKQACPKCGPTRKHRTDRSLSVALGPCALTNGDRLPPDAMVWYCHHCQWAGRSGDVPEHINRPHRKQRRWWS